MRGTASLAALALACAGLGATNAAETEEASGLDRAWDHLTFIDDGEREGIQKLALTGRAQFDAVWVEPDGMEDFDDLTWRRFRFGAEMVFLKEWTAHLEADFDLNEEFGDWYTGLTDAYVAWSPGKRLALTALKQSAGFTLDGATSSKKLLTLERNNLANNLWFAKEYFTGLHASGGFGADGSFRAGFFASDGDPEISVDEASWFTLASVGYAVGSAKLRVDHVYQDEDPAANTRDFEQVLALVVQWQDGPWGLWAETALGDGFATQGQSDVWGVDAMPFFDISPRTQVVLRWTYLRSRDDNGLRLNRYDDRVEAGLGDRYDELLVGYNVLFYDHKLKWQTGASWAQMHDAAGDGGAYQGVTLSTGLRVYW